MSEKNTLTICNDTDVLLADLTWIDGHFLENIGVIINRETGVIEDVLNTKNMTINVNNIKNIKYLKNKALIPGLINCHSHSFQRGLRGFNNEQYAQNNKDNNDSFWSWKDKLHDLASKCTKKEFYNLVYQSFYEMRRNGITSVAEFHYFHHDNETLCDYLMDDIILAAANDIGIRIILLESFYHDSGCGNKLIFDKQKRFYTPSLNNFFQQIEYLNQKTSNNSLQSIGIAAHSIRAVNIDNIMELHKYSIQNNMIMHMHIDEQINEIIQCKNYYNGLEPTTLLLNNLNNSYLYNFTTIHNTLTDKNDLYNLIQNDCKICVCPLTECNLGDGIFNLDLNDKSKERKLINNLCIGTDCNERIDMFEELRMLEYSQRLKYRKRGIYANKYGHSNLSKILFDIATINGANSLNLNNGQIKKDKFADMVCIDLLSMCLKGWTKNTLMSSIIFGGSGYEVVSDSCINGKWVHYKTMSKL